MSAVLFPGQANNSGGAEALASGEAIFPRVASTESCALVSGYLLLTYWTAATTGTATTALTSTSGTAAAGLTVAQIGIYSVASTGALTLAASTANLNTTLWTVAYTGYTSALATPFNRVAGQRYAFGVLAVGTTPPTLAGSNPSGFFADIAPILCADYATATMPPTVAAGAVTPYYEMPIGAVAP
jgi:hypothetical protein